MRRCGKCLLGAGHLSELGIEGTLRIEGRAGIAVDPVQVAERRGTGADRGAPWTAQLTRKKSVCALDEVERFALFGELGDELREAQRAHGSCRVFHRTPPDQEVTRAASACRGVRIA